MSFLEHEIDSFLLVLNQNFKDNNENCWIDLFKELINEIDQNGDVCITAEKNGRVRIRPQNIMIDADEDVDIKAGRNITLDSGSGRVLIKANKADCKALTGNLVPPGSSFGEQVFSGSFVGADIITNTFNGGLTSIIEL